MRLLHATPASGFALLSVLASAGLWVWSQRLPPSIWETTVPLAASTPAVSPAASPAVSSDVVPPTRGEEPVSPSPAETPVAPVAPAADIPATAASSTPPPAAPPAPSPSPTPSEAELTGPLPQHSAAESATAVPQPATPVASATPSQPLLPAPLDLAELSRQPEHWPRQVVLLAAVRFPAIMHGVNVGTLQVPAGSPVLLRKVNPDGSVEIELPASPGSLAKVKAQATDLLARAKAADQASPAAAPATANLAPPVPSAP